MKELKKHYKNLVIDFNKNSKTLTAYLTKEAQNVTVIEKSEKIYGETYINVTCIPTKSLITNTEKNVPYHDAIEIKNELTSFLRQKNYDNLDKLPSVSIITGTARFISEREMEVLLNETKKEVRV